MASKVQNIYLQLMISFRKHIWHSHWPAVVHKALPGPEASPVGCSSWWGLSAPEAALIPPQNVRTEPRSEVLFPSHGSMEDEGRRGLTKGRVKGSEKKYVRSGGSECWNYGNDKGRAGGDEVREKQQRRSKVKEKVKMWGLEGQVSKEGGGGEWKEFDEKKNMNWWWLVM